MRWVVLTIAVVLLGWLLLLAVPFLYVFRTPPSINVKTQYLPVGDTVTPLANQSRRYGSGLFGGYVVRSSEGSPLKRLYLWRVLPPGEGYPAGAATVDRTGNVVGAAPGYVKLEVSFLGKTGITELAIIPRIVEYGVEPNALQLRVGERKELKFKARLEGGVVPASWSPMLMFSMPNSPGGRYSGSPYVEAPTIPRYVPNVDDWSFDVVGLAPGRTTIYLTIAARELQVPITVIADTRKVDLHASGLAHNLLTKPGYQWQTHAFAHGHLHFLAGSNAAQTTDALAAHVDSARAKALQFIETRDEAPIEVFFVDTRAEMQKLVGRPIAGMVQAGERTGIMIYRGTYHPFLVHELTHLYTLDNWGLPPGGRWISEGLATLANGPCQGHSVNELAAGLFVDGKIRGWDELQRDFDNIDELVGNLQAASMIDFVRTQLGMGAVRAWWQSEGPSTLERIFHKSAAALEIDWRTRLGNEQVAARLDVERLIKEGCRSD